MEDTTALKVNFSDKIMAVTVLRLIPPKVTPNHLTIFRFATIPFVFYLFFTGEYLIGAILFGLSAFSDALDGALARTRNNLSKWGEVYDPLADKLLIGVAAVLIVNQTLGSLLAYAIVFFELVLIAGALLREKFHGHPIKAAWAGKIKMLLQSFGVGFVLLGLLTGEPALLGVAEYTLVASLGFAFLSLFVYYSV